MRPKDSEKYFIKQIEKSNIKVDKITLKETIDQVLAFYKNIRFSGVNINEDGDMLLVQWGVYDWGDGKYFEFDITRQFIEKRKKDDDAISQLHITLYYQATNFSEDEKGNKWFNNPKKTEEIASFISNLPYFKKINEFQPIKRDISWEYQ